MVNKTIFALYIKTEIDAGGKIKNVETSRD